MGSDGAVRGFSCPVVASRAACALSGHLVAGISDAVDIVLRASEACVLRRDGRVTCWPLGSRGELYGVLPATVAPHDVAIPHRVTAIAAEEAQACAATETGELYCWGASCGAPNDADGAVRVVGEVHGVRAMSSGVAHTCAVDGEGAVWCWGDATLGETGGGEQADGDSHCSPSPQRVDGAAASTVVAGGRTSCAERVDGAWCWGADYGTWPRAEGCEQDTPACRARNRQMTLPHRVGRPGTVALVHVGESVCSRSPSKAPQIV